MKPKSKKLSVINKIHHNDTKSSSLSDFTDLSKALDACASQDFTTNDHNSSTVSAPLVVAQPQDGLNLNQPLSKGCYDFSSLSESLSNIATLKGYCGCSSQSQKYRVRLTKDNFARFSRLQKIHGRKNYVGSLRRFRSHARQISEMARTGIKHLDYCKRCGNSLSFDQIFDQIFDLGELGDCIIGMTKSL